MKKINVSWLRITVSVFFTVSAIAQASQEHNHEAHKKVNERGDQVMGFSHAKTTHHFLLYKDGGEIRVEANDAQDAASRDQIRSHLAHIAQKFSQGDFNAPMLIHGQIPPGVPVLKKLKKDIEYKVVETDKGATVRITTKQANAINAVHKFLRFQIKDHRTGDALTVTKK